MMEPRAMATTQASGSSSSSGGQSCSSSDSCDAAAKARASWARWKARMKESCRVRVCVGGYGPGSRVEGQDEGVLQGS